MIEYFPQGNGAINLAEFNTFTAFSECSTSDSGSSLYWAPFCFVEVVYLLIHYFILFLGGGNESRCIHVQFNTVKFYTRNEGKERGILNVFFLYYPICFQPREDWIFRFYVTLNVYEYISIYISQVVSFGDPPYVDSDGKGFLPELFRGLSAEQGWSISKMDVATAVKDIPPVRSCIFLFLEAFFPPQRIEFQSNKYVFK